MLLGDGKQEKNPPQIPGESRQIPLIRPSLLSHSITNLKYWGRCEPITSKTLQLLNDLSIGYPFGKSSWIPWDKGRVIQKFCWSRSWRRFLIFPGVFGDEGSGGRDEAPGLVQWVAGMWIF